MTGLLPWVPWPSGLRHPLHSVVLSQEVFHLDAVAGRYDPASQQIPDSSGPPYLVEEFVMNRTKLPVAAKPPARSERRSSATWAAFVVGVPLAAGILCLIHYGPLRDTMAAKYTQHKCECVEVLLFCCAISALAPSSCNRGPSGPPAAPASSPRGMANRSPQPRPVCCWQRWTACRDACRKRTWSAASPPSWISSAAGGRPASWTINSAPWPITTPSHWKVAIPSPA